ncbi:MAG TPA: DUF1294 domain-containing protein [Candidatus Borkfalkia excrementavium]|uniref:DUF1294 domain-containing protein n=1 Tax=Candidatus Borkfalkia excrementavium TaxID=2838505 RepID=A0A9D1ZAU2_9FIRM|nr:DUF1294 domain-containing protein [Candidatus Borkfalkia excrementavium]
MLLPYIIVIVYIVSVNLYSFMLIKTQKRRSMERGVQEKFRDGKLFLAGLIGGAAGAYIAMFVLKFRTDNLILMIFMPLLIVLNIYLFIALFRLGIPAITF